MNPEYCKVIPQLQNYVSNHYYFLQRSMQKATKIVQRITE